MKKNIRTLRLISYAMLLFLLSAPELFPASEEPSESGRPNVIVVKVDGVINPVSAEFINKNINIANEMKAEALVIALDTPGGLDTSMRSIIKDIMASAVPVVVFVSPSGARAASAGTFITLAAHISAMAPGTNIGAAHPVGVGEKMDKTMADKATNDSAAYIRSLAEKRGKNADWAEDAVRKSISASEKEALEKNVIDLVSKNLDSLLSDINGRKLETSSGPLTLHTSGASLITKEMGIRSKILNFISDPSVAYILMMLGFYGLFFELTNPGTVLPGVLGAIFLILAFYSFQTLPVNYAGLFLIILALILFILEIKVTSYGMLTIGGIITMVIGSMMLFDSPSPFLKLSFWIIFPVVLLTAAFFSITVGLAVKAFRRKPITGNEGLIGLEGRATSDFDNGRGIVSVHGEIWSARSDDPLHKGDEVEVLSVSGLTLRVKKKEAGQ